MAEYITKSGDTWDIIAYEQLGSCSYVEQLINANRACIGTAIFSAGTKLTLPAINNGGQTSSLPPWRK